MDAQGYIRIRVKGDRQWRMEHRVIMEKLLGRPLLKNEQVHHKNKKRSDNRPSNLELWNTKHPPGARVKDLVCYAKEILRLYGKSQIKTEVTYA